jgi:hypothetical protein
MFLGIRPVLGQGFSNDVQKGSWAPTAKPAPQLDRLASAELTTPSLLLRTRNRRVRTSMRAAISSR